MNTTDNQPNNELHCEHCGRNFVRATSAMKHLCERKQRWMNRDLVSSRLGYNAWLKFYEQTSTSHKNRDFREFTHSNYYTAFVRWGNYCHSIDAVNPEAYLLWLLKNKIGIDQWAQDTNYDRYLQEFLRAEDALDAVNRAFRWAQDYAEELDAPTNHCLRYGNVNRVLRDITKGKVSPWVLYHSATGYEFLSKLNPDQEALITPYINPELWKIVFARRVSSVADVKAVLEATGW